MGDPPAWTVKFNGISFPLKTSHNLIITHTHPLLNVQSGRSGSLCDRRQLIGHIVERAVELHIDWTLDITDAKCVSLSLSLRF